MSPQTSISEPPPKDSMKAVMFCPECGYEGRLTEWESGTVDTESYIQCPGCAEFVVRRQAKRNTTSEI